MTLPDDYLVRRCLNCWVVVGPSGLFVIGRAAGDAASASERTASMAHTLRTRLADVMSWVPFVSAVVVGDRHRHDLACPMVELDELGSLLRDGGQQIGEGALQVLRHHVPGAVQQIELARGVASTR